ncbi:MAG: LPS assembly lipoprotein LptE [Pseudomonadota bacterium]
MLSDRITRRAALLGLTALAGCGFAPIHGTGSTLREQLTFDTQDTVAGFELRGRLEERLGVSASPRYLLKVTQTSRRRASAIAADGDTTRFNLLGTASWTLTEIAKGDRLDSGDVQTFTGFATTGSTSATQAAEDDASRRLSVALADMIVSRLLLLEPSVAP